LKRNGFRVLVTETNGHALMAVSQLWQLYFFFSFVEPLLRHRVTYLPGRILSVALGVSCNLPALASARILPSRTGIYLSNLVLAEKLSDAVTE
jgi:hypothetical protein